MGGLRELTDPFVVPGPSGLAVRARLRVSETDAAVLRKVGAFLGSLAAHDLAVRCRQALEHDATSWARRKRELSEVSSARWAGSITKATHDQWSLARRCQAAEKGWLRGQIARIEARLARPLGARADKRERLPRGYGSRAEWHAAVAIGRRALGHPIRRRTAPPRTHQSDGYGHRTAQAGSETRRREETRPRLPGPRTRCVPPGSGANAGDQRAQHRSGHAAEQQSWHQDSLPLSL
ncbi:hypothetical protein [Streptomyces noursei]|uniref:hypothetical protein n=1 Tax=Streptomyces noursei TaxID=1971 RepID=UPI003BF526F9